MGSIVRIAGNIVLVRWCRRNHWQVVRLVTDDHRTGFCNTRSKRFSWCDIAEEVELQRIAFRRIADGTCEQSAVVSQRAHIVAAAGHNDLVVVFKIDGSRVRVHYHS